MLETVSGHRAANKEAAPGTAGAAFIRYATPTRHVSAP